jgi:hybrid cluster-associated redox disulfide protein
MTPAAEEKNPRIPTNPKNPTIITKGMRVSDILTLLPNAAPLIAQYGLSCYSCSANDSETLEEGCRSHSMKDQSIDDLVTDLNELFASKPARPQILVLTDSAATALKEILAKEGKSGWGLKVGLDENGGFSMEFVEKASSDDRAFSNGDVSLFASDATLAGIGGATIDVRDGRFKLDLPEDNKKGCACGGTCDRADKGSCACESGGGCDCH